MRCYICDWSPDGDSLFHETLELNSFSDNYNDQPPHLIELPDGKIICSVCEQISSVTSGTPRSFNEYIEHEEYEEIE